MSKKSKKIKKWRRLPLQPIVYDADHRARFRKNAIVTFLLDAGSFDMNALSKMPFSRADREQFAQLIGYSLTGFEGLPYVSAKTFTRAARRAERLMQEKDPC